MEILSKLNSKNVKNCIITIGNFDGFHIGHADIIKVINKLAVSKSSKSLLVTFNPAPREVLSNSCDNYLITSFNKKMELLEDSGLDFVYVVDFDENFAAMDANDYIEDFLFKKFNPSDIVVGYDHFFGRNREGSFELLNQYKNKFCYELHKINQIKFGNIDVKSNIIRTLVKNGDISKANNLLGRNFSFYGQVVRGKGLGGKLSLPTANIQIEDKYQLLPKDGVYHTDLFIKKDNKKYDSVCNIGVRPTFNDDGYNKTIEVHILDEGSFNIYDYKVELFFKNRIRDEIKFNDEKELINQINLDKEYCINN